MPNRKHLRAAKSKIMPRDGRLCGIHFIGCGRPITDKCEVDHIIPLSLAELIAPTPREFDNPWNYQPMHEECNREKADMMNGRELGAFEKVVSTGANTPDDWPRFQCKCHYLQIIDGDMYVCTQGIVSIGQHKLYVGVVKDFGDTNRQDGILVLGRWTGPGGGQLRGFNRIGKNHRGSILPSFSPKRVEGFNVSERSRVGLPTPKSIYIDQKGYVTPIIS